MCYVGYTVISSTSHMGCSHTWLNSSLWQTGLTKPNLEMVPITNRIFFMEILITATMDVVLEALSRNRIKVDTTFYFLVTSGHVAVLKIEKKIDDCRININLNSLKVKYLFYYCIYFFANVLLMFKNGQANVQQISGMVVHSSEL